MRRLLGPLALIVAWTLSAMAAPRPDLIVVVSIDQFPAYYLTRFAPYFAPDGFNRFLQHGANMTAARYPYATTYTGPGHAAIGTGDVPARSGIVSNNWYERIDGAAVYCVDDARVTPPYSPVNLQSDSLGDRLQEKYPGAKVISVSLKDRAAILMGGRKATAAYWLDPQNGTFTSSSWYRGVNRTTLAAFNATIPEYVASHKVWEQSSFIPAADLSRVTHDPEGLRKYKTEAEGMGVSFPHPIRNLAALTGTPFGNDLAISLAERLAESESIGTADGTPDLLFVSLSSQDYLGHRYGPDSLEAADSVVRLDRELAGFFMFLDQHFGDRYALALSSDHGVQSIPEVARDLGRDAGRVTMRNPGKAMKTYGDLAAVAPDRVAVEQRVALRLGRKITPMTPLSESLIAAFEEPAIYVDWERVRSLGLDRERVKEAFRAEVLKIRGVSGAFTNTQLLEPSKNPSDLERAVRLSFRADRSGDVLITLRDGYIWGYGTTGTTHGEPVEADQRVPVLLWGRGITAGKYAEKAAPTDLARSLGALVGVDAGGPESHRLPCVSEPAADPPAATDAVMPRAILTAALADLDPDAKMKLIMGDKITADVRAAAAQVREVVDPQSPAAAELARTLPAGYGRLDSFEVAGDRATVRIWTGPVPQPQPGVLMLACGTGHTLVLERDASGAWRVTSRGITVC